MPQTCPECSKDLKRGKCPECGWVAPTETALRSKYCPITFCGGILVEHGYCDQSGGYPITTNSPFVCPFCTNHLGWDGSCIRGCLGTYTRSDKKTWSFPGDRYEVKAAHWVKAEGPTAACPEEKNRECLNVMYAVLDKRMTVDDGLKKMEDILNLVPF